MGTTSSGAVLEQPVAVVRGVGATRLEQLARLGIRTVHELLLTLPLRHEDRRHLMPLAALRPGTTATARGLVQACGWVPGRHGAPGRFEAHLSDGTGRARCVWFGAHYLRTQIRPGQTLVVHGRVGSYQRGVVLEHPEFEVAAGTDNESLHIGRLVPVYPLTEGLPQRVMRRLVWEAVQTYAEQAAEFLPEDTRRRLGLPLRGAALREAHFPETVEAAQRARTRLVFEEFLAAQMVLAERKLHLERVAVGIRHQPAGVFKQRLLAALPFALTAAQERALAEIEADMAAEHPMHRLLQGDVGCGKTVVAAVALANAIECGSQAAVMAPTEILAAQHYETLARLLGPLGIEICLLSGAVNGAARAATLERIRTGRTHLVIGTHALIQAPVTFARLGAVVIDEQHKFGVAQRGRLYGKGVHPDVLVMTATPIPRTLAMTVYGDLDVSVIDELPPGRPQIVTRLISAARLPEAYAFIRKQIQRGRQAYFVYPVITGAAQQDVRSAERMFAELRTQVFPEARLGLVHGELRPEERNRVMEDFRAGRLDVLVSTTVVEVGVDVPNATVMLVEQAERFGLAQLHQLRGRVGRGTEKSFCLLVGNPRTREAWERLKILETTRDGFRLAEEDLRLRGMGNLLGPEQSGLLPMRVGNVVTDHAILVEARREAFRILAADPQLREPEHQALHAEVRKRHAHAVPFAAVG